MNPKQPKYEIILNDLLSRLEKGDFSYNTVFCTEKQLSEQYDVSRITAKRAITELEQKGLLYRKRGVGSFVSRNALNTDNQPVLVPSSIDTKMISFLLPFSTTQGGIYYTIEAVNSDLGNNGYLMNLYISNNSSTKEKANLKQLLTQKISGLVYYPYRDKIHLDQLNEFVYKRVPVIIIDKSTDCPYIHNVTSDNFEGGRLLTEHLLEKGHRNICFFTTAPLEETSSVRNRFSGYLHQLQLAGIQPDINHFVQYSFSAASKIAAERKINPFHETVKRLYDMGITAIIAENDEVAQRIYLSCEALGLRIPEDISLCGFDATSVSEKLGLTSIKQDFVALGQEINRILVESISNPLAPAQKVVLPVELVVRQSTGAPRTITQAER